MNHVIAYELINSELDSFRQLRYEELVELVNERASHMVRGGDGVDYEVTTTVRWCSGEDGDIRVRVFIGEANWGGPHDPLDDTIVISVPNKGGR
jgi:hypothetical protein